MKKLTAIILLLLALPLYLTALPTYYDTGSQVFTISAGPTIPFFYYNPNDPEFPLTFGFGAGDGQTHHTVGGFGSISYQVFLNEYFAIGGELGYHFDFVRSNDVYTSVPILLKFTYVPLQGDFEIPISLGIGLDYIAISDYSSINLGVTFEIGMRYFFTNEWGAGITAGFHMVPEIYGVSGDSARKNSFYATVPLMVSVVYRH